MTSTRPLPSRLLPAALLLCLSACGKPTYRSDKLAESVRDICRKEYKFDVSAHLAGRTLYAVIEPQALVGADLGLDRKTVERLYDTLLTVTRVALSTDAPIDYLVVRAKDANTGATLTLLRYVPDIKYYFYMRISRSDFEKRGILEIDAADAKEDPDAFHDITRTEFMARLAASSLQQKITYNPLVSVFVRVHRVKGEVKGGILTLRLNKYQRLTKDDEGEEDKTGATDVSDPLLRRSVVEDVGNMLNKYDKEGQITGVRVVEDTGRVLFSFSRADLMKAHADIPKKKLFGIEVEEE